MWIFTPYGFFSVVNKTQLDDNGDIPDGILETIEVRTRHREHLELLIERFPDEIGEESIFERIGTDYEYRIVIDERQWITLGAMLAADVTYPNFKDEIQEAVKNTKLKKTPYLDQCYDVYNAMFSHWVGMGNTIN